MSTALSLVVSAVVLGAGTFALRLAGPVFHGRVRVPTRVQRRLEIASVVLLAALVATAALFEGYGFAGVARPTGVAVGGVLAWRRAPFVVVVLAAAATAAGLRLLGVP
jgi:branched-subunit amino acid transport protein